MRELRFSIEGFMNELVPSDARSSPSTARNKAPILEVLRPRLPMSGLVLEIAAGAGEHAVHMAAVSPELQWLPTDPDPDALVSIAAWTRRSALPNLLAAIQLDASDPDNWPLQHADAVVSINMIHISPWTATQGLMEGAGRVLPPGGPLFLYGPYFEAEVEPAPSNLAFDASLKARDPRWGVRNLDDVAGVAAQHGLLFAERIDIPANNLILVFRKA